MKASTHRKSRRGKGKRRRPSKRQSRKTSRKTNRKRRSKSRRNSRRMRRKVGGTGEKHENIQLIVDNIDKLRFLKMAKAYEFYDKFEFENTNDKLIFKLNKGITLTDKRKIISKTKIPQPEYGSDDKENYFRITTDNFLVTTYEISKPMIIEINHTSKNSDGSGDSYGLKSLENEYNRIRDKWGIYSNVRCCLLEYTFYTICTLYDQYKDQHKDFIEDVNYRMQTILILSGIEYRPRERERERERQRERER